MGLFYAAEKVSNSYNGTCNFVSFNMTDQDKEVNKAWIHRASVSSSPFLESPQKNPASSEEDLHILNVWKIKVN